MKHLLFIILLFPIPAVAQIDWKEFEKEVINACEKAAFLTDYQLKINNKMIWNYRVLAHEESGKIVFKIHVVQYDAYTTPIGYNKNPSSVCVKKLEDLELQLKRMKESKKKTCSLGRG